MQNLLLKYMNQRLEKNEKPRAVAGPVITISRECGCEGSLIAQMLTNKINEKLIEKGKRPDWKWVSKEILNLASEELKIHPEKLKKIMTKGEYSLMDEILSSFTEKNYVYDAKVKKAVYEIIRNLAVAGKAVIVGRGSSSIAWDIPKSIHVRLEAPMDYKAVKISRRKDISFNEAKKYVATVDKEREKFRDVFKDNDVEMNYHLRFNCKEITNEEICEIILKLAELKKLF